MRGAVTSVLDFFLPRFCPSCRLKLNASERLVCDSCILTLELVPEELQATEYNRKFLSGRIISDFYSHFLFTSDSELRHIIHALKYEKHFRIGILLGELMCDGLSDRLSSWNIDLIIPIPLHYLKKSERGYNQSRYIAAGIRKRTGIKISERAVIRIVNTKSQTTMTMAERKLNVSRAFKVKNKRLIKSKNILIVDDVITTGSTLEAMGRELINAGAAKVFAASAALADLDSEL